MQLYGKVRLNDEAKATNLFETLQLDQNKVLRTLENVKISDRISIKNMLNKIISAYNGNKRRNLMQNKILYYRSLPSVTYIVGCRGASQLGGSLVGIPPGIRLISYKSIFA